MNWDAFITDQLTRTPKANLPDGCGFVAATDAAHFIGFQLLYASIVKGHRNVRVALFDLGLKSEHLAWCRRQPLLDVLPFTSPLPPGTDSWVKWCRPWFLLQAPYRRIVWMDCDTLAINSVEPLFVRAARQAYISGGPGLNVADRRLLDYVGPVANDDELFSINSGVLAFDRERPEDRRILETWAEVTMLLHTHPDRPFKYFPPLHDEAVLRLTIQKLGIQHLVVNDERFNRFIRPEDPARASVVAMLDRVQHLHRHDHVVHYLWVPKPWDSHPEPLITFDPHRCA